MHLIERIDLLRAKAFAIYEIGKVNRKAQEEIAKELQAVRNGLYGVIKRSSFSERIHAMKSLKDRNAGHLETIKFYQQKILDNEDQIENIEKSIIHQIKENHREVIVEKDFSLAIIKENGQEKIRYR